MGNLQSAEKKVDSAADAAKVGGVDGVREKAPKRGSLSFARGERTCPVAPAAECARSGVHLTTCRRKHDHAPMHASRASGCIRMNAHYSLASVQPTWPQYCVAHPRDSARCCCSNAQEEGSWHTPPPLPPSPYSHRRALTAAPPYPPASLSYTRAQAGIDAAADMTKDAMEAADAAARRAAEAADRAAKQINDTASRTADNLQSHVKSISGQFDKSQNTLTGQAKGVLKSAGVDTSDDRTTRVRWRVEGQGQI